MTLLENSYWNSNGKYQVWYETQTLVPVSGNAGTIQGEMVRAGARIYYDYYNNGMINNTSGAVRFLQEYTTGVEQELSKVYNECNQGTYTTKNLEIELETIINNIFEYVISTQDNLIESDIDLFTFQENDCYNDFDDSDN